MTKIQLLNLTLTSFKGISGLTLSPNGNSLNVLGRNATGKTTLFDAFTWLLFGKDSHGAAAFQIKPRAEQSVIGELLIDG